MSGRLFIHLGDEEMSRLIRQAKAERRRLRDQAVILIERALRCECTHGAPEPLKDSEVARETSA